MKIRTFLFLSVFFAVFTASAQESAQSQMKEAKERSIILQNDLEDSFTLYHSDQSRTLNFPALNVEIIPIQALDHHGQLGLVITYKDLATGSTESEFIPQEIVQHDRASVKATCSVLHQKLHKRLQPNPQNPLVAASVAAAKVVAVIFVTFLFAW